MAVVVSGDCCLSCPSIELDDAPVILLRIAAVVIAVQCLPVEVVRWLCVGVFGWAWWLLRVHVAALQDVGERHVA